MAQKTILVITDGIGYNESSEFNAFAAAKKPTYDWLFKTAKYAHKNLGPGKWAYLTDRWETARSGTCVSAVGGFCIKIW